MQTGLGDKYNHTGSFRSKPPKFSWGGLSIILLIIAAIVGMALYQKFK
jgi:hypothetical protein